MRTAGGRLLKFLARMGLYALVPIFIGITVVAVVLPGLNNAMSLPEIPPEDQVVLDQAVKTQGGERLASTGYKATIKISDPELVKFLDQEEKKAGLSNPGPYVLFSLGKPKVAQAEDNGATDAVVDVSNGAIVAVSQEFTNGRGSMCYNSRTPEILQGAWPQINLYLKGKSMPQLVPIDHDKVAQLPQGYETNCFVYPS